jgi:signal transduction histidine kinase/ActR/RegA family two-component response regulator
MGEPNTEGPTTASLLAALVAGRTVAWEWDLRTDRVVRTPNAPALLGLPLTNDADRGLTFEQMIHPEDRARVREQVQAALTNGTAMATEFRLVRPDGSVVWVVDDGQFELDAEGKPLRMMGILRDITEQKRLEANLEQARQEAAAASQAKDLFLATLSHELRTPLNAVLGWARMLAAGDLEPDTAARAIAVIERNAESQARLIEDLLDFARITTGKLRLDLRPIDLGSVVERAIDVVHPAADAKGVRLHVALDHRAGPVMGDAERLQQAVWNLLTNAVKFTPRGGRVQVFLTRVNSHVEIQVSDSGIGIPADVLPYIFDRFRQGSHAGAQQGLGLGLTLAKHLVELHGGTLVAESPGLDRGALFSIALPLMIHSMPDPAESQHPTVPGSGRVHGDVSLSGVRVLAIDDARDSLDMLGTLLRSHGADVRTADSARQGFATLWEWTPHVLICDIEMPEEDGYDFLKRVRALPDRRAGVPAIAVTAYARTEDRVRAIETGFNVHLPKPLEPAELLTMIKALAARAPE